MPARKGLPGTALLQQIEKSRLFQAAVITVIILSALAIGAKTYDIPPGISRTLSVMDVGITLFFLPNSDTKCNNTKKALP